jgi:hypothetical protein
LPQAPRAALLDDQRRVRTRHVHAVEQLVFGGIREQRKLRALATRCQRAVAADEEPVVGVAHDRGQERWQGFGVLDAIVGLAVSLDQPTIDLGVSLRNLVVA